MKTKIITLSARFCESVLWRTVLKNKFVPQVSVPSGKGLFCGAICIFLLTANCLLPTFSFGQNIGINTTGAAANGSALLDVGEALVAGAGVDTKGALIPRVALTATNSGTPIVPAPGAPEAGLVVYNTATAGVSPNNVVPGFYYWNGTKWISFSGGTGGNDWSLLGNAGTVDGTNFLGTTDNIPFNIRVNNQPSGRIDPTLLNTFWGYQAGIASTGNSNTANGYYALTSNTSGNRNTAIGLSALRYNTTGVDNIATGRGALYSNTSASQNIAIGNGALYTQAYSTAMLSDNVAIGYEALYTNNPTTTTNGFRNTAVGSYAMRSNTIGYRNTAAGDSALYSNTSASQNTAIGNGALYTQAYSTAMLSDNVAIGYQALFTNNPTTTTNGWQNTAVGSFAMRSNTRGSSNTALGYQALFSNTTTNNNTALGYQALYSNRGSNNTANGYQALYSNNNSLGNNNTATGYQALYSNNADGRDNTASGYQALYSNTIGYANTATGLYSLYLNTKGYWNTANGVEALYSNTTASQNTAIGNGALYLQAYDDGSAGGWVSDNVAIGFNALRSNNPTNTSTGIQNTAVGSLALYSNTIGVSNTAIGMNALNANTTGNGNTASGKEALDANTTGGNNTANGLYALRFNTQASQNTAVGSQALYTQNYNAVMNSNNVAIGYQALYLNNPTLVTNGYQNTAVGSTALDANTTGSNNTALGYNAFGTGATYTNSTAIGANAVISASNNMVFGDGNVVGWGFGVAPGVPAITVGVFGSGVKGNGATLTQAGVWTVGSSRKIKDRVTHLNGEDMLKKISVLEVAGWKYIGSDEYHIGPFAEQFYKLFHTGNDSLHISYIDPSGVALIGIQQLMKENKSQQSAIDKLQTTNDKLQTEIFNLKSLILNQDARLKTLEEMMGTKAEK